MNSPIRTMRSLIGKIALLAGLPLATLQAQTFNWGSPVFSDIRDSSGAAITDDFSAQIGVFINSFVPTFENAADWQANWKTLSVAEMNASAGYFTGTFDLTSDGSSNGAGAAPGTYFSGTPYLWVFGPTGESGQAEWFLARSSDWQLPDDNQGCCGGTPTEWSTSDFGNDETPVVGAHDLVQGGGSATAPGVYHLQTYAVVIPEPGTLALLVVSSGLCLRRRRNTAEIRNCS